MSNIEHNHPVCAMCDNSRHLKEQAQFVQKQAEAGCARARKANTDIANLDIQGAFDQLHKMVAMIGGKSKHMAETAANTNEALLQAAE